MTQDNIEEVKKILREIDFATLEFDIGDISKELCALFPQPLPDEELLKEIARTVCCFYPDTPEECKLCEAKGGCPQWEDVREIAVQLLTLLQQRVEEARREGTKAATDFILKHYYIDISEYMIDELASGK